MTVVTKRQVKIANDAIAKVLNSKEEPLTILTCASTAAGKPYFAVQRVFKCVIKDTQMLSCLIDMPRPLTYPNDEYFIEYIDTQIEVMRDVIGVDYLEARSALIAVLDYFTLSADLTYASMIEQESKSAAKRVRKWLYNNLFSVLVEKKFLNRYNVKVMGSRGLWYTTMQYSRTLKFRAALCSRYDMLNGRSVNVEKSNVIKEL